MAGEEKPGKCDVFKTKRKKNVSRRKDALTLPNAADVLSEISPENWPYMQLAARMLLVSTTRANGMLGANS